MNHILKIESCYFNDILRLSKTFELRKNDRDFKVGDTIILREGELTDGKFNYTGRSLSALITYVLKGGKYGLNEDYCIFSFSNVKLLTNTAIASLQLDSQTLIKYNEITK